MEAEVEIARSLQTIADFLMDNRKHLNTIIKAQAKEAEFKLEQLRMFEEICKTDPDYEKMAKENIIKEMNDNIANPGTEVS